MVNNHSRGIINKVFNVVFELLFLLLNATACNFMGFIPANVGLK